MTEKRKFLGFYPNKTIWAGNAANINGDCLEFLPKLFSEIVYSFSSDYFELKVCRDGMFLISLKFANSNVGIYLDYINAFYVTMESVISQNTFQKYFSLQEITIEDYIYHEFIGDKVIVTRTDNLNIQTNYQYKSRQLSGYIPVDFNKIDIRNNKFWRDLLIHTINNDDRNKGRWDRIVSVEQLELVARTFERICQSWEHVNLLSKLVRVVQEINLGNYTYAISYSWLIIEIYLDKLYYTNNQLGDKNDGQPISSRDLINGLRDRKVLPRELANEIHQLRITRNGIIHKQQEKASFDQAALAVEIIREFIRKDIAVDIKLLF